MALKFYEDDFENYGKCLFISNEKATLAITLDVGPRIISYSLNGGDNMLKVDLTRSLTESGAPFDAHFGPGAKWYNYGGHRFWISPEKLPDTYYPDNGHVEYVVNNGTVELTPPPQTANGLQLEMKVTMDEDSSRVTVEHRVTNLSDELRHIAAWAITVVSQNGFEVIPQPDRETGLLANRTFSIWEYTNMADPRLRWGKDYIIVKQDYKGNGALKIGLNNERGWAAYFNHGCCFVKRLNHIQGADYPDGGMSFETYTNPGFLEIESLSPFHTLSKGSSIAHTEHWELLPAANPPRPEDDASITAFVKEYIEK